MTKQTRKRSEQPPTPLTGLSVEEAFIALFIGAMEASGHVSATEAARAHNIIRTMKMFRRKSGDVVGRLLDRMRTLVENHGAARVIVAAAGAIPTRLRPTAFAIATDLMLADGKIERAERRFLDGLGKHLKLDRETALGVLDVIRIKNSA